MGILLSICFKSSDDEAKLNHCATAKQQFTKSRHRLASDESYGSIQAKKCAKNDSPTWLSQDKSQRDWTALVSGENKHDRSDLPGEANHNGTSRLFKMVMNPLGPCPKKRGLNRIKSKTPR